MNDQKKAIVTTDNVKDHDFGFRAGDEIELREYYIESVPRVMVIRAKVIGEYRDFFLLDTGRVKLPLNKRDLLAEEGGVKAFRVRKSIDLFEVDLLAS